MTTKLRFTLLLGVLLCGFIASGVANRLFLKSEQIRVVGANKQTREKLISSWIEIAGRELYRVTSDWSNSDEFIAAISDAEFKGQLGNIRESMRQANVATLWLIRADGSIAVSVESEAGGLVAAPPITKNELSRILNALPAPRFFSSTDGSFFEFSACANRGGKSDTWLLVARTWSSNFLANLSKLTDSHITIVQTDAVIPDESKPGQATIMLPLHDWQGKTIRVLRVEYDAKDLESALGPYWTQVALFAGFGLAVLAAMALALQVWVLRPMSLIRESLTTENSALLKDLAQKPDEFGQVARLVISAFRQKAALRNEIVERNRLQESLSKSESALRQSIEDRARLGRDLHDGVIQSLYAAGMGLAGVRAQLRADQGDAVSQLEQTRGVLNETIRDVRNFIVGLEPEASKDQLFSQAVELLLKSMGGMGKFESTITIDNVLANRLSLTQRAHALQITREAVSNALRHGKADKVKVTLQSTISGVLFEVADNGCGFDATSTESHGKGLANFALRARDLGAELQVSSDPGQGTRIEITFFLP